MKKLILIAVAIFTMAPLAGAWEFSRNPDRFPSIGLRIDNTNLTGDRSESIYSSSGEELPYRHSDETEYNFRAGGDVRLPVSHSLTFTFAYDQVENDDYFTRHNVIVGGDLYKEHRTMKGYSYGIGVRLYLNK